MVASRIDEVEGNEVTRDELMGRFYTTYLAAVDAQVRPLDEETRDALDTATGNDLNTILDSIDFVSKQYATAETL